MTKQKLIKKNYLKKRFILKKNSLRRKFYILVDFNLKRKCRAQIKVIRPLKGINILYNALKQRVLIFYAMH